MSGAVEQTVAAVLGVPADSSPSAWSITDHDQDSSLFNVHYKHEVDMDQYGKLRGCIVDTAHKAVVSKSYGYTATATLDELPSELGEIQDDTGKVHQLQGKNFKIYRGYEGTLIKVYLHNNRLGISTHRRIHTDRNHHPEGPIFQNLFLDAWPGLGGADRRERLAAVRRSLYPETAKYSPHTHLFLLLDPSLTLSSKILPSKKLLYLGNVRTNWTQQPQGFDETLMLPSVVTRHNEEGIYKPEEIDVDAANRYLSMGFFKKNYDNHPRLKMGEFVVIYVYDDAGNLDYLLRVQSTAYAWRSSVRGYGTLYKRMFSLLDECNDSNFEQYKQKYFIMQYRPLADLKEQVKRGLHLRRGGPDDAPRNRKERFHNAMLNLILASSNHHQKQVIDAYGHFLFTRGLLAKRLLAVYQNKSACTGRVETLMGMIRSRATSNDPAELERIIHKLMLNEYGGSLRSLFEYFEL